MVRTKSSISGYHWDTRRSNDDHTKSTLEGKVLPTFTEKLETIANSLVKICYVGQAQWLMPINLALWDAEASRSPEVRSSRPSWPTRQNLVSTKNMKISWAWWHVPVVPSTLVAEVGGSIEPGRSRLQWAMIMSPHSRLGDTARPCLKKYLNK